MKVAVIGGRDFNDYSLMNEVLSKIDISLLVSGGAKGADRLAEKYALEKSIPTKVFKADWDRHGKSAGYIRNYNIILEADMVVAFWDGISKGTKHGIDLAEKYKKDLLLIKYSKS